MNSSRFAPVVALLLVSLALVYPAAQSVQSQQKQPQVQQQPTFRAGVNAVRVDVIVSDRQGNPVDNLTAADFELTEDGKPQPIDNFKLVRVQTEQEPGGEAPREIRSFDDEAIELARDDVRIVVIFLDEYHVTRINAIRLREWFHRFIETQVGPYDLVALMYPLTPTAGLTFSRDKFALTSIIDKFEGRRGDYMPRNDVEANQAMQPAYRIEQLRSEIVLSALKSLSYHLGSLNEGRKSVIVVAEGMPAVDMTDVREVIDAANRNNVAFYPLDPNGLGSSWAGSDILRTLADNTNGRAIVSRNDIEAGLGEVLRDSAAYYLLGYNSSKGADGKFHEIRVRSKRPGLDVRARKGYWALTAEEAAVSAAPSRPAAPTAVTDALGALAEPAGRGVRTWIGMARGENGRTRVTFVWEPVAGRAGDRPERVMLVASGPSGSTYFNGPVGGAKAGESASTAGPAANAAAAAGRVVFEVPPGKLQLKMTMERGDPAAPDVLDRDAREVEVPNLAGTGVALSTPVVLTGRTPREFRLLSSDPNAVPVANRVFNRTDRLQIRFELYDPGASKPVVSAQLLNRSGDQLVALTPQASAPLPGVNTIDLPLTNLARGDYVIEITAKGESGQATQMVGIRIAG